MDEKTPHRAGRLDEFTESEEQLWQEEEQQHGVRENDREASSPENHA